MKIRLSLKIVAIIMLPLLLAACKSKDNPLNKLLSRGQYAQNETVVDPPKKANGATSKDADDDDDDKDANKSDVPKALDSPVPVAVIPPPEPDDDFLNRFVPLELGFVQCGNNVVSQYVDDDGNITGEECEDGNAENGDGCSSTCIKEFCGNGRVEPGEQCDPGQAPTTPPTVPPLWNHIIPTDDCDEFCQNIICGDCIINGHEECDDGNRVDCDGCSSNCKLQYLGAPPCNFACKPTSPFTCSDPTTTDSSLRCTVLGEPKN